jgi:hypothetical protein
MLTFFPKLSARRERWRDRCVWAPGGAPLRPEVGVRPNVVVAAGAGGTAERGGGGSGRVGDGWLALAYLLLFCCGLDSSAGMGARYLNRSGLL